MRSVCCLPAYKLIPGTGMVGMLEKQLESVGTPSWNATRVEPAMLSIDADPELAPPARNFSAAASATPASATPAQVANIAAVDPQPSSPGASATPALQVASIAAVDPQPSSAAASATPAAQVANIAAVNPQPSSTAASSTPAAQVANIDAVDPQPSTPATQVANIAAVDPQPSSAPASATPASQVANIAALDPQPSHAAASATPAAQFADDDELPGLTLGEEEEEEEGEAICVRKSCKRAASADAEYAKPKLPQLNCDEDVIEAWVAVSDDGPDIKKGR